MLSRKSLKAGALKNLNRFENYLLVFYHAEVVLEKVYQVSKNIVFKHARRENAVPPLLNRIKIFTSAHSFRRSTVLSEMKQEFTAIYSSFRH